MNGRNQKDALSITIMSDAQQHSPTQQEDTVPELSPQSPLQDWGPMLRAYAPWAGFRLSQNGEPVLCWRTANAPKGLTLFVAGPCSSSMDLAWQLVEKGLFPDWASVLVTSQSSGRGQFGRQWHSPTGNVYGSLRVPLLTPPWRGLVPLLLAEAVRDVLRGSGLHVEIKWPNDMLVRRKKVGGILIEERLDVVVAGIGLNLTSSPSADELHGPNAMPPGCLKEFGVDLSPPDMWMRLVCEISSRLVETVSTRHPEDFVRNLESHLAYVGEKVIVDSTDMASCPAMVQGIDISGGLKVRTAEGERVLRSGSIYPVPGDGTRSVR